MLGVEGLKVSGLRVSGLMVESGGLRHGGVTGVGCRVVGRPETAHIQQSRPDCGLGFQVEGIEGQRFRVAG